VALIGEPSLHAGLTVHFNTPYWFSSAPLSNYSKDKITADVRDAGGPHASPGKVVAELMFGFWTDLAAQRYHWTLWQPCLSTASPNVKVARPVTQAETMTVCRYKEGTP
jgi:hypothetical protein